MNRFTVAVLVLSFFVAAFLELRQFHTSFKEEDYANPLLTLSEPIRWILGVFMFLAILSIGVFGVSSFIYFQF